MRFFVMNYVKTAMLPAVLTAVPVFFGGMLGGRQGVSRNRLTMDKGKSFSPGRGCNFLEQVKFEES